MQTVLRLGFSVKFIMPMKILKRFSAVVLSFVMLLSFAACTAENANEADTPVYKNADGTLSVHFIDVGQGDSEFIQLPNGETMLIDAGESDAGETVVSYLQSLSVSTINYVVATHPHSDHIGGLPDVFDAFDIEKVFMPDAVSDSYIFEALLDKIEAEGCETVQAANGVTAVDDKENKLLAEFIAPVSSEYENLNNYSAVLRLEYNENSFLFMGDAESLVEKEILKNGISDIDVLKIGHHGSKTSSSTEFVNTVSPSYAVFEVGQGNSYGHPHKEVLERYEKLGADILRTDEMGTIIISSDGRNLTVNKDSRKDIITSSASEQAVSDNSYVLNTNSKKIHLQSCPSVSNISDKNKKLTDENIESLEEQGYTRCKACLQ